MDDRAALDALFAAIPVSDVVRAGVRDRMSASGRYYHGAVHLARLWRRHVAYSPGQTAARPPWHTLIACAIGFHDAIYDPMRRDNEARSADLWSQSRATLAPPEAEWVRRTILATANHLAAAPESDESNEAWEARAWMLDLDLSPLGDEPAVFDQNTADLRAEFKHLDDAAWRAGRRSFMASLRGRALFRVPVLATAFEAQAQSNIGRALAEGD